MTPRVSITIKGNPHLDKQTTFALASSLTMIAKRAQPAIVEKLHGTFTIRNNWTQQSNALGVRVKPATKQNLTAIVGTAADWLEKFIKAPAGTNVVKLPQGDFLAIPTANVRRTKRDIIQRSQRPRSLIGKRDFIIVTKNGKHVLFQRRGRGRNSKMVALYVLVPKATVKAQDVLFGPTTIVFNKHWAATLEMQLKQAFATAR